MTKRAYARGYSSNPVQPMGARITSVRFLRTITLRYLRGDANDSDLRQACEGVLKELRPAAPAPGETRHE